MAQHPRRSGPRSRILSLLTGLVLALPAGALVANPVSAATLAVPGGFADIQSALDAAASGDTISVAPGEYVGNLNFQGKNVRLQSSGGPAATTVRVLGGTAVTIGPGGAVVGFTVTGARDSFGAGMAVSGGGTLVQGNIFDGNTESGGGFGAAIGGNNASPTIDRNVFRNNTCDGQFLAGVVSFVNTSSPLITNNLFAHNPCRAVNLTLPEGSAPRVLNNTMVDNRTGVRVDGRIPTSGQSFRNNLIVGNQIGLEVEFGSPTNNPTWDHNDVFGNGVDFSGIAAQTGRAGNISADPGFIDPATDDYHLTPGSAAVDSGGALNAPTVDLDGAARPADGNGDGVAGFDLGAYELAGSARSVQLRVAPRMISLGATASARVTVLSAAGFNAPQQVIRSSLRFGRTGTEQSLQGCNAPIDVNADGRPDLVCRYRVKATGLRVGDTRATLAAQTFTGGPIGGVRAITVVP